MTAEPFATLTDSQLEAVANWAPDLMAHAPIEAAEDGAAETGEDPSDAPDSGETAAVDDADAKAA